MGGGGGVTRVGEVEAGRRIKAREGEGMGEGGMAGEGITSKVDDKEKE